MKKMLDFITLFSILFLTIFSFSFKSVIADGMVIRRDPYLNPYGNSWDYSEETNQQAFINYDNGRQKMIITIGLEDKNSSSSAVWLFPIPSTPEKIAIDVVKDLPDFQGYEISDKAKSNMYYARKHLFETQLYTIPFLGLYRETYGGIGTTPRLLTGGVSIDEQSQNIEQDVVVYEHLEKEGITSEIITAKTASALYDYLKDKGLDIESGSIPVLNDYIGKEYSFIASWISFSENPAIFENKDSFGDNIPKQRGILVDFPTEDIYFPLLPTSVYGSKVIPITIRVIGHVSPKIFDGIKGYTKTEYYIDEYASFADTLKNLYDGKRENLKYTKIKINAPAKFLTEDLWIKKSSPLKTYYSSFFAKRSIGSITILFLITTSLMAGILAGRIAFNSLRKNTFKLGLIALSNCLSIFGLMIVTFLVNTKGKDESIKPLLEAIKQKGYFWKRKLAFILLLAIFLFLLIYISFFFSLIIANLFYLENFYANKLFFNPLIFLFVSYSLIKELSYFFKHGYFYSTNDFLSIIIYFIILSVSIAVVSIIFILKRIKPEDKNLFEQLKLNNYSSWSFQPKDRAKILFVPLFSILFLTISWLLTKLVELTV